MPDYPQAAAGERIRARRLLLDSLVSGGPYSSMEAFGNFAGSSGRMVADAELGKHVGAKTRLRISRGLFWTDDSLDRLYRNEEPIERSDSPLLNPTSPSTSAAATDRAARAEELRRRLDLIPDVYDNYGPQAAREAIKKLSDELKELLDDLDTEDGQPEVNAG